MKTDPKAGDVFDHVEPREPKTKGVIYKFVEGLSSDARVFMLLMICVSFVLFALIAAVTTYNIASLYAPDVSLEKKEGDQ